MACSRDWKQQISSTGSRCVIRDNLLPLDQTQLNLLPFPIGCEVLLDFRSTKGCQSFICGKVVGAFLYLLSSEVLFEVHLDDGSTCWHNINELTYAPNTQIYYSPSSFTQRDQMAGTIILAETNSCSSNICYSIMLRNDECSERIRIVEHVPFEQIKCKSYSH
jgi:hypothetical protein